MLLGDAGNVKTVTDLGLTKPSIQGFSNMTYPEHIAHGLVGRQANASRQ